MISGWRARTRILFDLSPAAFTPPPKVVSSVVELIPVASAGGPPIAAVEAVTAYAFGQRRKMLRQSLKGLGVDVGHLLDHAGIEPTARAEEIDIAGFLSLALAFVALRSPVNAP